MIMLKFHTYFLTKWIPWAWVNKIALTMLAKMKAYYLEDKYYKHENLIFEGQLNVWSDSSVSKENV